MIDPLVPGAAGIELAYFFVRVAVLVGCGWLLVRACAGGSAAVRHGVWAATLTLALSLPVLRPALPVLPIHLPASVALDLPAIGGPLVSVARPLDGITELFDSRAAQITGPDDRRANVEAAGSGSPAGRTIPWSRVLFVAWLAGVVGRFAWIALQSLRAREIVRRGVLADPAHRRIAAEVAGLMRIRRPIRVIRSPVATMPLTWGVFRPVIALPEGVYDWPEERVRVALLHETAHISRWDYLTSLVAEIASAVYWPVPPVWMARRRMRAEQERSCDDRVLAAGTSSVDYAQHLLEVARDLCRRGACPATAVMMAGEVRLRDRVTAILAEEVDRRPLHQGGGLRVLALLACVLLPIASVEASVAASHDPAPTTLDAPNVRLPEDRPPIPELPHEPASIPAADFPVYLWIEAERGSPSGTAAVREDLDASGAGYLALRPRESGPTGAQGGSVDLSVDLDAAGEYVLWMRIVSRSNDRLHLSLNGEPLVAWRSVSDSRTGNEWTWHAIPDGGHGHPLRVSLPAGSHRFTFGGVGERIRIDRILLTTDHTFRPADRGPSERPFPHASIVLQAEHAAATGRLRNGRDSQALGGEYLVFRSANGSASEGRLSYTFSVDHPGRYLVWGRVLPRGDDENSVFVTVDGGQEWIWDVPSRDDVDGNGWRWTPLNARDVDGRAVDPLVLDLAAGSHVLELRTRESGTALDAILITSDLTQRPRQILEGLSRSQAADSPPRGHPPAG